MDLSKRENLTLAFVRRLDLLRTQTGKAEATQRVDTAESHAYAYPYGEVTKDYQSPGCWGHPVAPKSKTAAGTIEEY